MDCATTAVERLESLQAALSGLEHGLSADRWLALGRDVLALLETIEGCQSDEEWGQVDRQITALITRPQIHLATAEGPVSSRVVAGTGHGEGDRGVARSGAEAATARQQRLAQITACQFEYVTGATAAAQSTIDEARVIAAQHARQALPLLEQIEQAHTVH